MIKLRIMLKVPLPNFRLQREHLTFGLHFRCSTHLIQRWCYTPLIASLTNSSSGVRLPFCWLLDNTSFANNFSQSRFYRGFLF